MRLCSWAWKTNFAPQPSSIRAPWSQQASLVGSAYLRSAVRTERLGKMCLPLLAGPAIDLAFSGGACTVNDTDWVSGITVDCIAPSATISILPAVLTSPYQTRTIFTDTVCASSAVLARLFLNPHLWCNCNLIGILQCAQECRLEKTFGVASDNVVFVLENGAFNISALVSTLEAGLTTVLGEFSSLAGDVVGSSALSATLAAVNAASTLLG